MASSKKTSKKTEKSFVPPMPVPVWNGNTDEQKEQWEDFKSYMETFWDQLQELQRTTVETWKKQWEKAFPQFMDMHDNFAAYLPDELPTLPGMPACPLSPKYLMDKMKDFREMANKHAVEQTETFLDFVKQGQKQAKKAVKDVVKNIEEDQATAEDKAEKPAEKPAEKTANKAKGKTAGKSTGKSASKPAGKSASKPADKPAEKNTEKSADKTTDK